MSKSFIFLVKPFLGKFCRHLVIYIWSYWPHCSHSANINYISFLVNCLQVVVRFGCLSRAVLNEKMTNESSIEELSNQWIVMTLRSVFRRNDVVGEILRRHLKNSAAVVVSVCFIRTAKKVFNVSEKKYFFVHPTTH